MPNILDELVRVGAFPSKGAARQMIKNGGVSVIPAYSETAIPPCFRDNTIEDVLNYHTVSDRDFFLESKLGLRGSEGQARIYRTANIQYYDGKSMKPDGTEFPVRIWDNHGWNPTLAQFRENLMHGTGNGIRFDCGWIMTWDTRSYGKNPWQLTDPSIERTLKYGDVIRIGKNKTFVVEI